MPNWRGAIRPPPPGSSRPTARAIARALEVLEATGRPLADWQREGMPPILDPACAVKLFLVPDRAELHRRIDARFDADAGGRRARRGARRSMPAVSIRCCRP